MIALRLVLDTSIVVSAALKPLTERFFHTATNACSWQRR